LVIQGAKATVAVGLEGTHAEFISQCEGLVVVGFGLVGVWGIAMHGDVTEEAEDIRLNTTLLIGTGKIKGVHRRCPRILQTFV
jgi:hypothetical protein